MALKHALARGFELSGLNSSLFSMGNVLLGPHARAVNYHDVPPILADAFEKQLCFYAEHFTPVGLAELRDLLAGKWTSRRPGIILTFDDGLRSHADVVAPLLDQYGLPGWFMVPVDFVETEAGGQAGFAKQNSIQWAEGGFADERIAMTWDDLRRLDGPHVIGCHTRSHVRLNAGLTADDLRHEIAGAKRRLEQALGHEVVVFAWVGGEERSYSTAAARAIQEAGFELGFMTNNAVIRAGTAGLQLQRSNIEADFPFELLRLTMSGFYDLLYLPKRRRVNRLTRVADG